MASAGLHAAAGLLVLFSWGHLPATPREVPATIEVLFGHNADVSGATAPPARPPPPPKPVIPPAAAAPPVPKAPAEVAQPSHVAAAPSPAATPPPSPAPAHPSAPPLPRALAQAAPVRLGDGDVGLKLDAPPDPNMIEAQADPGNRAPKYPDAAWMGHEQGRVIVRLHIDTDGRVAGVDILQSSGHPTLDRAARDGLSKWHFIPALRDGAAVPSFRDQAINFVLD